MIDQGGLERAADRFPPPERSFERLVLRRARKDRNRRIATGVFAIVITLVTLAALLRAFRPAGDRTAHEPKDIFAPVHGWIAHGTDDGIWAVDPEQPTKKIRLSARPGEPIGWSRDGSALLLIRAWSPNGTEEPPWRYEAGWRVGLVVLHADGTETRVVTFDPDTDPFTGSSLSPDGSQVVFVTQRRDESFGEIYVVDADGDAPQLIRSTPMEPFVLPGWRGDLYWPAFSPDGTRIAYFHGGYDHSQDLKVMDADGTNVRSLFGDMRLDWHVGDLVWSPDGSQLAFATDDPDGIWGIWVIGADGSGYRRVIPHGEDPSWSPDGSRIAFRRGRRLFTVKSDGSDLREIGEVPRDGTIAWNPVR